MAARLKFTPAQMIQAITRTHGMISYAATLLGCEQDTIQNYKRRYPSVAKAIQEARARMTETAEMALYDAIKAGEGWAIMFYLRTQGKSRGYVERHELTGAEGEALHISLTWDDGSMEAP